MEFKEIQGNVAISISTDRITEGISKAQKVLDAQIIADCDPYVPFEQGALRNSVHVVTDGLIEWNTPYAHYQYEGIKYVDPVLGVSGIYTEGYGWWSRKGVTKIPTNEKLNYHEPNTGDHWFERAKEEHMADWERLVKDTVRGAL